METVCWLPTWQVDKGKYFLKTSTCKATSPLQSVNTYLCGPTMSMPLLLRSKYFISFTDNFNKKNSYTSSKLFEILDVFEIYNK